MVFLHVFVKCPEKQGEPLRLYTYHEKPREKKTRRRRLPPQKYRRRKKEENGRRRGF